MKKNELHGCRGAIKLPPNKTYNVIFLGPFQTLSCPLPSVREA